MNDGNVSLKEYVMAIMADNNRAVEAARASMEKRLDGMNEFRQQLKDQSATLLQRNEYNAAHFAIQKELKELQLAKAAAEGKASMNAVYIAYAFSFVGIVISVVEMFLRR